jgi:hypothetical protein
VFTLPTKLSVSVGEKITLSCSTDENVRLSTIKWYRNGHKLTESSHVKIERDSINEYIHSNLIIKEATLNDAGVYTCKFDKLHNKIHVDVIASDEKNRQLMKSSITRSNPEKSEATTYFSANSLFAFSKGYSPLLIKSFYHHIVLASTIAILTVHISNIF